MLTAACKVGLKFLAFIIIFGGICAAELIVLGFNQLECDVLISAFPGIVEPPAVKDPGAAHITHMPIP